LEFAKGFQHRLIIHGKLDCNFIQLQTLARSKTAGKQLSRESGESQPGQMPPIGHAHNCLFVSVVEQLEALAF
jgi:hypothetical protein